MKTSLKDESEYLYSPYCVFALLGFSGFYFYNLLIASNVSQENIELRLVALTLTIVLFLRSYWPHSCQKYLKFFWYLTITFNQSFFFTYMLWQNNFSYPWQLNQLTSLTIIAALLDFRKMIICVLIGGSLASLLYYIQNHSFIFADNISTFIASYITILIFCFIYDLIKRKFYISREDYYQNLNSVNASLEQKVKERTAELESALSVKTEFLNNISHEIRTPINGFSMATENLMQHWQSMSEKERKQAIEVIAKSASRIRGLANHLIEATKINGERKTLNLSRSNITDLIRDIVEECKSLYLNNKNVKFKFGACKDFYCNVDDESLGQLFRNILINAIKFSPNNSIVKINLREISNTLEIRISDQGVGIPEDELEIIFNAFVQSSRTKTGAGGVGLGLSIAKQIAHEHGGNIRAENNDKIGASFIITLPIISETKKNNFKDEILVIDDEESMLLSLEMGLKAKGFKVHCLKNGTLALKYLENNPGISVILLDIMMPGINGLDVLGQIKSKYPHIRVIMQSGVGDNNEIAQAKTLGAEFFIRKPYSINEIIGLL